MTAPVLHRSIRVTDRRAPTFGRYGVVRALLATFAPQTYAVQFLDGSGARGGTICLRRDQFEVVTEPTFQHAEGTATRAEMLAANVDDEAVCEWLRGAAVGDHYPAFNECRRVA